MAAHLMRALIAAAALLPLAAGAQALVDPTLPPPGYGAGDARPAAKDGAGERAAGRRVQMIVRGPGEARMAVIDGARVRAGDAIEFDGQAMRVERIGDDAVVLARGTRRAVLELLPGARKAVRCAATATQAGC